MARPLYLCDPRKNSACRGTVCFYGKGPFRRCFACTDPACALTGAEGEPLEIDQQEWRETCVCVDKREPQGPIYERGAEDAQAEDAAGAAGDL